jgi:isoquinoline 1-oxidoreductase subunit alpha
LCGDGKDSGWTVRDQGAVYFSPWIYSSAHCRGVFTPREKEVRMISLEINGKRHKVDVSPDVPLLWVIREYLKLTGTKFGCGIGMCGSCTVHVNGRAERSCQIPVGEARGKKITTIEGLPEDHPVKVAWIKDQVPQCGYCQSGQIMQAAALLAEDKNPSEEKIVKAMDGNLCRCGTYPYIKLAIKSSAKGGK